MTRFNIKLFDWVLEPAARGYNNVIPKPGRIAVSRFFDNLFFPLRFVNNLLQFKIKGAAVELARFTVNTTIGILGFSDPADAWLNLKPHNEDFGQTLGLYGAPGVFHIVLPFFGPSNLRDAVGLAGDRYLTYSTYVFSDDVLSRVDNHTRLSASVGVESYERLNDTSLNLAEIESLRKDALDIYILTRDAYEQNRKMKIKD
jgi:phospholipid-binding lipoprotein MlaA